MERIIKTIMNNHADDSHLSVSRAIWKRAEKWQAISIKISLYKVMQRIPARDTCAYLSVSVTKNYLTNTQISNGISVNSE